MESNMHSDIYTLHSSSALIKVLKEAKSFKDWNTELLSTTAEYEAQYETSCETDFRRNDALNPTEWEEKNGAFHNSSHLCRKGLRNEYIILSRNPERK